MELLQAAQGYVRDGNADPGERLMRLEALLDPRWPLHQQDAAAAADGARRGYSRLPTLGRFRPLRVAFADGDADFMATPLVESFTRLSWWALGTQPCAVWPMHGQDRKSVV